MARRAIPDFIRDAAAKAAAAQHDADWQAELTKRRQKEQQARSITAQMRKQYQCNTILPSTASEQVALAEAEMDDAAGRSNSSRHAASSVHSGGVVKEEERSTPVSTQLPAPSALSSSPSTLPSTFLEWKAKRAATATSAATSAHTAAAGPAAASTPAKHPLSASSASLHSTPVTKHTVSVTPAARHPTRTVAPSPPSAASSTSTAAHSTAAPASQPPSQSSLPPCPQGAACTRQNATHRANFSHPTTAASASASATTATNAPHSSNRVEDNRPEQAEDDEDGWETGRVSSSTTQTQAGKKRLRRLSEDEEDETGEEQRQSEEERAMPKPVCPYGAQCYRVNAVHLRQYQHPMQTVGTMKAGHAR